MSSRRRLLGLALLALLGVSLTIACLSAATSRVFDPDVHWLAAAGRQLLVTGHVPSANVFSYTAPDHPWLMHEWLLSPLYAWLLESLGPSGLPLLALASCLAMAALQLQLSVGRADNRLAGLLVALFAAGVFAALMASPRPTVVARLFPVGMLALATVPRFQRRHAAVAVLLEWVWANAHGSFPLGLVILLVAAAATDEHRALRLKTTAAAALFTLLNPAGWHLHALVLGYLTGGSATLALVHAHVREFRSAFVLLEDPWPFFELGGLALVFVLSLHALARRRHRARAALALVLCLMGLAQARHVMLAILLGAPLLLPEVESLLAGRGARLALPSARGLSLLLLLPASLLASSAWWLQRSELERADWIHPSLGGASFARLATQVPDGAHVYTHFGVAGRLIWLDSGRGVRVFYDSRNDCYPADVVREAFELADPEIEPAHALSVLQSRGTDTALLGPFGSLGSILAASSDWQLSARDGSWQLWTRSARSEQIHGATGGRVQAVDQERVGGDGHDDAQE